MQTLQAPQHFDDALLDHPRRALFLRLIAAWLVLTALCALAALRFGMGQVDAQLADRVNEEAAHYATLFTEYVAAPTAERKRRLDQELARLTADGFRIIRLYDTHGDLVVHMQTPGTTGYDSALTQATPARPDSETEIWHRTRLMGHPHLIMAGAIRDRSGTPVGYGTAIYRFDEQSIDSLEGLVRMVSLMVAATVFASLLLVYPLVNFLNKRLLVSARELMRSNIGTLKTLGSAIAKRDGDTALHNYRVTICAVRLAEALKLDDRRIQRLIIGSFLHDIGKIATPDAILLKQGGHTTDERRIMRQHVGHGVDIVKQYPWLATGVEVVAGHHERYDGSGYPLGLKGEAIPLIARIFSIADVFDALASTRPYKQPYPYEKIVEMLTADLAGQFDPAILATFVPISRELYETCSSLDEKSADAMLTDIVERYFPGIRNGRRAGPRPQPG